MHIRNNMPSAFTIPLHVGRATKREQITLAKGYNEFKPDDAWAVDQLAGSKDSNGKWRGGVASEYFNSQGPGKKANLQIAPPPVEGDKCHHVVVKAGVKTTHQSRQHNEKLRNSEQAHAQLLAQAAVISSMQVELAKLSGRDQVEDPLLDPGQYTVADLGGAIDGLDVAELVEVLTLEVKGKARSGAIDLITDAIKA